MKRASYREGIEIIALNDDPTELEIKHVVGTVSVHLMANLFDVSQEKVALDVIRHRLKEKDAENKKGQ
jgi:hypothetical protein